MLDFFKSIEKIRGELSHLSQELQRLSAQIEQLHPSMRGVYTEERTQWLRQYEEEGKRSLQRLITENKEAIMSTRTICEESGVHPRDLALYFSAALMYMAGMSLQGMCGGCNGQLQLLVDHDELYLTCSNCGRWLVQGLKHIP